MKIRPELQTPFSRNCDILATFFAGLQIMLATWLCSGVNAQFLLPMFAVAICAFGSALGAGRFARDDAFSETLSWGALFFAAVCAVQYLNPWARQLEFANFGGIEKLPYIKWLPTSVRAQFTDGGAAAAFCYLQTAFLTVLVFASMAGQSRRSRGFLYFFVLNAFAMGGFAVYQKASGALSMYSIESFKGANFYGSFFLSNAAGAFLNMGVAAALACAFLLAGRGWLSKLCAPVPLLAAAGMSYGVYDSESVGALYICALVWAAFALLLVLKILKRFFGIWACAVFAAAALAVGGYCASENFEKIAEFAPQKKNDNAMHSAQSRLEIYKTVCPIILERPIWGYGGESGDFVIPLLKGNDEKSVALAASRAHSDLLGYLLDFGFAGGAVLAACGAAWLWRIWQMRRFLTCANAMCFVGAMSCFGHSLFDMELHIPSTMLMFGLMCVLSYAPIFGKEADDEI